MKRRQEQYYLSKCKHWERWCFYNLPTRAGALCWISNWASWCRKQCACWCPRASISWSGDPEKCFSFLIMSGLSAFIKTEISGLKVQKATRGDIISLLPPSPVSSKNNPTILFFWCHLTEITWGLIIFLGWKPYAISCSCIRLSCVWWNQSIKSWGKRREGKGREAGWSLARS